MDRIDPGDYNIQVKEVIQVTQIIVVGHTTNDGKEFEMVVASNRRPLPVPYSEEP